jgi:hypothetical protein
MDGEGGGRRNIGKIRPWQDSNLQSPDPKSGALSIRPQGLCKVSQVLSKFLLCH